MEPVPLSYKRSIGVQVGVAVPIQNVSFHKNANWERYEHQLYTAVRKILRVIRLLKNICCISLLTSLTSLLTSLTTQILLL